MPTTTKTYRIDDAYSTEIATGFSSQSDALRIAQEKANRIGATLYVSEERDDSDAIAVEPLAQAAR